jgi:hypothetical protein
VTFRPEPDLCHDCEARILRDDVTVSRLTSAGSKPRARADTRDESGTEMAAKHDGGFVGGKEDTTFEICGASDGHGHSEACAVGQMSAGGHAS